MPAQDWNSARESRGLPRHRAEDHINGTTGTGAIVLATSPTLTTPTIASVANIGSGTASESTVLCGDSKWRDPRGIIEYFSTGPAGLTIFDLAWCEARFESDSDGGAVGTINDFSAAGSDWTQSTAGNKPTFQSIGSTSQPNGLPYWSFDGSDDFMTRAANITDTSIFVMAVLRKRAAGSGYTNFMRTDQLHMLLRTSGADQWGMYLGGDVTTGEAMTNSWKIYTWIHRGFADVDMGSNGGLINYTTGASLGGSDGSTTYLGADSAGRFANMDLAAFAIGSAPASTRAFYEKIAAASAYFRSVYFL